VCVYFRVYTCNVQVVQHKIVVSTAFLIHSVTIGGTKASDMLAGTTPYIDGRHSHTACSITPHLFLRNIYYVMDLVILFFTALWEFKLSEY
jgi:hypothetical protein